MKEVEEVFVARKSPHVARALSRASRRWPTDFLIHEASRGARAMGATRRYAGMRLEIEHATSEDAAERQHAELGAARPGESCGKRLPAAGGLRLCGGTGGTGARSAGSRARCDDRPRAGWRLGCGRQSSRRRRLPRHAEATRKAWWTHKKVGALQYFLHVREPVHHVQASDRAGDLSACTVLYSSYVGLSSRRTVG